MGCNAETVLDASASKGRLYALKGFVNHPLQPFATSNAGLWHGNLQHNNTRHIRLSTATPRGPTETKALRER